MVRRFDGEAHWDDEMLRGIGFSLIATGAFGVLAALQSIGYYLNESWFHWDDLAGFIYSGAFAASGAAAGVILFTRRPLRRGELFWIALLGASVCAPLVAIHIVTLLWGLFSGQEFWSIWTVIMFPVWWDGWWPPQEFLFCDTLMYASPFRESLFWHGAPLHEPLQVVCSPQRSLAFWACLPLAICLQAIWGRKGKWADMVSALLAVLLSVLLVVAAAEIALLHYQQAAFSPGPEEVIDYLYHPQLSWYVYFATVVLWLLAFAVLLARRKPD